MFGSSPTVTKTRVNNKDGSISFINTRTWPDGRYTRNIEVREPSGPFSMRTVSTTTEQGKG